MFAEQGYEATSLDSIARAIGLTRTAVYHYFPSKRDVAQAMLTDATQDDWRWWVDAAGSGETLGAKLRAIFAMGVERATEDPTTSRVYLSLVRSGEVDEGAHSALHGYVAELQEDISRLLEDAVADGGLPASTDRTALTDAILGMLWALAAGVAEAPDAHVRGQVMRSVGLLLQSEPWLDESFVRAKTRAQRS
jgi:AcrR family transcriptional regulator